MLVLEEPALTSAPSQPNPGALQLHNVLLLKGECGTVEIYAKLPNCAALVAPGPPHCWLWSTMPRPNHIQLQKELVLLFLAMVTSQMFISGCMGSAHH